MPRVFITELMISGRTAQKLIEKHDLTAEGVRSALERVPRLRFSWEYHPIRGQRAILKARIEGKRCLVVLYPDRAGREGLWHLGSAYEDN